MAKHPRKRQKIGKAAAQPELELDPLGASVFLDDEADKDDEERRLESLLFGTPYIPTGPSKNVFLVSDDEEDTAGVQELQNLEDTDVSSPFIAF